MTETYRATKCPCGHPGCRHWHVWPVAAVQGVGFTQKQAEVIVGLLNTMEQALCEECGFVASQCFCLEAQSAS